jgi:hypothetical protein
MEKFLTTKQVLVFDRDVLVKGAFITLGHMEYGDDGGYVDSYYSSNGIISDITDVSIRYISVEGVMKTINIDQIFIDNNRDYPTVPMRILGIRKTVAEGRE